MAKEITSRELSEILASAPASISVVDVREPNEFAEVRIRGSKNLPLSTLSADSPEIDWSKDVVFVCRSWARSGRVTAAFEDLGKSASNLIGGVAGLAETNPWLLEFPG